VVLGIHLQFIPSGATERGPPLDPRMLVDSGHGPDSGSAAWHGRRERTRRDQIMTILLDAWDGMRFSQKMSITLTTGHAGAFNAPEDRVTSVILCTTADR
jgi:hypothetical protein